MIVKKDSSFKTLKDLDDPKYTTAVLTNPQQAERAKQFFPKAKVLVFDSVAAEFTALKTNRADAAQLDTPVVVNKSVAHTPTYTHTYTPTTHTPSRSQQPRQNNKQYPVYERVFSIKPDIQNDIYHLSDPVNKSLVGTAYIPDYKTSVLMNQLFRNIKENANLDSLEESDSDDEFENDRVDKFVYLDREYIMTCAYNHKFKKWVPLRVVDNQSK